MPNLEPFAFTTPGNTERLLAQTLAAQSAQQNQLAQDLYAEAMRQYEYRKQYDPNTWVPTAPIMESNDPNAWFAAITGGTGGIPAVGGGLITPAQQNPALNAPQGTNGTRIPAGQGVASPAAQGGGSAPSQASSQVSQSAGGGMVPIPSRMGEIAVLGVLGVLAFWVIAK